MNSIIKGMLISSLILVSSPVWAYLDPSTGSMVISAIVGLFASIALAMKTYWYKIKSFFRGDERSDSAPDEPGA